jgi:molecular chaperone IbpA
VRGSGGSFLPFEVLYQGIAARAFERVFRLADFVEVKAAVLANGLLHIDLVREIPEAMKPRTIRMCSCTDALQGLSPCFEIGLA